MSSLVELSRLINEWVLRLRRIQAILQPPQWSEESWRKFSHSLALLVRQHGTSWVVDPQVYWDLRWKLQDDAELICQLEHTPGVKTTLIVAQTGGFAKEIGSYTWLWAEFGTDGEFSRDPYWVDGTWKEALSILIAPLSQQAGFYLKAPTATPSELLLQPGARPNPNASTSTSILPH